MHRRDTIILGILAAFISLAFFLYFFHRDELLLYGDAVAHINIARRVFDSQQPGPLQLGTVWLPLPHVLMLPSVAFDWAWRTGAAGAAVSMLAYVLGALAIFRLIKVRVGRKTAWLAAITYLANPNLIYLQTTAMTEPLYLALFIWTIVLVSEFFIADRSLNERNARRYLRFALLTSIAMVLTRYDGWFAASAVVVIVLVYLARRQQAALSWQRVIGNFVLPLALVPILWFAYNARFFGDALAFARGPYSARAISARSAAGGAAHPGDRNLAVAAAYFLKAAQLNVGEGGWGRAWLLAAAAGSLAALAFAPAFRVLLLLWLPLPFYALSIAYAGAPVFLPEWPPFSYYNSRYGLEMLPAIAVFGALLFTLTARRLRGSRLRALPLIAAAVLLIGSYVSVGRATPVALREARVNSVTRVAFQQKLAQALAALPASSTLLMYTGDHVGALQRAGIDLKRTVNETLFRVWERALSDPASAADYVIALEGDAVWRAVQARSSGLTELSRVSSPGQPTAVIYKANPSRQ